MPKPSKESSAQTEWFVAFGEPTRLALIRTLAAGEKTVTQLATEVGTEMVNVSHHLKIMKDAGVVTFVKDGRFMIYSLAGATVTGTTLELSHPSEVKVSLPLE
ncbi:family transcriptional regulator : Probable transcription regulator OS=Planctomyces maris DSM 8797 GN=PM8797T_22538 PE=4 SV=1: HTH_20 [Gemmata massiliana]|uniref:HTH arsR-type domain-containing protein n=1 Tax=Gemmata massiliana TaxID=1210884 RepID=A0A6P2D0L6_9BACT|nr:metalloregulator ArsR/SmtB family transcription factor [Gemmata massiliana]VTR94126.1 family transcriptional regulator : Probable transcription regulator OS=Planctomyces maris DSM 8797 GN=PM8797T_22538 PE=4 SV=1: HTH_20 [Gemmata massiliana]